MARGADFWALRSLLVWAALAWLSGCAGSGGLSATEPGLPILRDITMSANRAQSSLVIGQTTKAEALAVLGPATVIKFDSGYEVWAYRSREGRSRDTNAELVILFTPAGVVHKSRIRPATGVVSR